MATSAHTLKIRVFSRPQSWWIITCIGTRSPPGLPVHRVCHHAWLFSPNIDCRVKHRSSHLPSKLFISWYIYPASKFTFVGKAKSCPKWWTEFKDLEIHLFHTSLWKICWVYIYIFLHVDKNDSTEIYLFELVVLLYFYILQWNKDPLQSYYPQ